MVYKARLTGRAASQRAYRAVEDSQGEGPLTSGTETGSSSNVAAHAFAARVTTPLRHLGDSVQQRAGEHHRSARRRLKGPRTVFWEAHLAPFEIAVQIDGDGKADGVPCLLWCCR